MRTCVGTCCWTLLAGLFFFVQPSALAQEGFHLDTPAGWSKEVSDDRSGAIYTAPDGSARIVALRTDVAAEAGLAEVVRAYEGFVKQSQPNMQWTLRREGQTQVAGLPALEREYSAAEGTQRGRILTTFVKRGTLALAIHASVRPEEAFARVEPVFRKCLATLKIGATAPVPDRGEADRKLAALEAARQAGVLSQEEYERKRAAILAAVPALDEPTKKKLAALEAARKAGILSDEEYARKMAALLGGGAQPAPAPQQRQGVPVRTNRKGKVYRHPVGFSFWYPASWSIKEHESFLQLIPADAGQSPEGPTELYFVGAEDVSVDGIREPTDPRVVQVLGEQVRSLSPFVQQVGGAQPVKMSAGKGVMFRWEGKTPRGDQVDARAFVSILRNHAAVLLAVGFKERIQARVEDMGRMFASFGFGEGQRDPALVGRWTLVGVTSITNQSPFETDWSRAQLASKTESTLVFAADGRWERHDKSHMIVGAGGVWLEDNDESTQRGRWNAGEGLLFMVWEDSSWDDFRYQIRRTAKGIELRTLRGSKGEVWHRAE
ncbi:MAG: SHOCT domain-containing protein [Planctomycetota bacterium]|jgi:hypothetical protein